MNLKPYGERVLVEKAEVPEKVGSIYVPTSTEQQQLDAKVVAVGTGEKINAFIKVGDTIRYVNQKTTDTTIDDKTYTVVHLEIVVGKVE
jgi:co-chaperonin GroES (HSP10)